MLAIGVSNPTTTASSLPERYETVIGCRTVGIGVAARGQAALA